MSSDKNANDNNNDNNKKKTIRYWPLIVFGIIILIPLLLIILARANFALKIKGIEFSSMCNRRKLLFTYYLYFSNGRIFVLHWYILYCFLQNLKTRRETGTYKRNFN